MATMQQTRLVITPDNETHTTTTTASNTVSRCQPRSALRITSASERNIGVKRITNRQQSGKNMCTTDMVTNTIIDTLAGLAQSLLYPPGDLPKKAPETPEKERALNVTTSTMDTDEEGYLSSSAPPSHEEDATFAPYSAIIRRSVESRTPPPNSVGSPPVVVASLKKTNTHRPVGTSPARRCFDPVPMARMRAPPPSEPAISVFSDDVISKRSEAIVAEKHKKWRRQIRMQNRRRLQQDEELDDSSVVTACGPPRRGQKPVEVLRQLIRAPCVNVSDVFECEAGNDDDDDWRSVYSDESTRFGTSVGTDDSLSTTDDESEAPPPRGRQRGVHKKPLKLPDRRSITPPRSSIQLRESLDDEERSGQSGVKDKNFIKAFISEMSHDGMMLIWHGPHVDSVHATSFKRPCGVISYIHLGSPHAENGNYEGPQLAWRKQDGSHGGAIDLFDIQSLDTASLEMLGNYQFAIPGNSFFVVLNDGRHVVFEASSDAEARRFVHGLRWVVARLSFNLVVGNPLVCCELLSVSQGESSPQTPMEEAQWAKAMNDVTNHLVKKSLKKTHSKDELSFTGV